MFRRLFDRVNTAYRRVDDGRRWALQAWVHLPAHDAVSSPCLPPLPTAPPQPLVLDELLVPD